MQTVSVDGLCSFPIRAVVDDFSENSVNNSVSTFEKIELMSTDDYVAVLKLAVSAVKDDSTVTIQLDNGTSLRGMLPPGRSVEDSKSWLGKTFD